MNKADFTFQNHGSVWLLQPHTQKADDWIEYHVQDYRELWWGNAIPVEHRYVDNVANGIIESGLTIN